MAGLHGAAASSAGWAWFGGGSLAAGGGGMALGHIVLPGIGTAVAVGVSASISHSQAKKIEKECEDIEVANKKNDLVLHSVSSHVKATQELEEKLALWDDYLAREVAIARRQLRPFGFASYVFRLLRYLFSGSFYSDSEFVVVDRLEKAVDSFLVQFQSNER
jgi:hypothetical protein